MITHGELIIFFLTFLNLYLHVSLSWLEGLFWRAAHWILNSGVCDLPVSSGCTKELQKKIYSLLAARLMQEQAPFDIQERFYSHAFSTFSSEKPRTTDTGQLFDLINDFS